LLPCCSPVAPLLLPCCSPVAPAAINAEARRTGSPYSLRQQRKTRRTDVLSRMCRLQETAGEHASIETQPELFYNSQFWWHGSLFRLARLRL